MGWPLTVAAPRILGIALLALAAVCWPGPRRLGMLLLVQRSNEDGFRERRSQ